MIQLVCTHDVVEFLKGEVDNLSIDSHGQLVLGPATELVYETSAPFLWSMLAAPDGGDERVVVLGQADHVYAGEVLPRSGVAGIWTSVTPRCSSP